MLLFFWKKDIQIKRYKTYKIWFFNYRVWECRMRQAHNLLSKNLENKETYIHKLTETREDRSKSLESLVPAAWRPRLLFPRIVAPGPYLDIFEKYIVERLKFDTYPFLRIMVRGGGETYFWWDPGHLSDLL